jgi:hypothetical protein
MKQQESLEDIQEKFEHWRSTRKSRCERIPVSLWQSAAVLTKSYPIHVIAKALRLNGNDLKKQVQKYCGKNPAPTPQSDFIELSCDLPSISSTECIVELADPAGARMRISMQGKSLDVPGLIASFWNRAR